MADVTTKRYASAGLTKKGLLASYELDDDDDLDMISGGSQAGSDRKELDSELRSCWKASPERVVIIYLYACNRLERNNNFRSCIID